jgi:HD-like signal output (HDOD) protein
VVLEFSRKATDPNVGFEQLAGIVEADSGMTFELLKHVNSSFVGLRHQAACVHQAISALGPRRCRNFLLETALQDAMNRKESKLIDLPAFWKSNLQRALFAKAVAKLLDADQDIAFTGAMLQDFLLPWLANYSHDRYAEFLREQEIHPVELVQFEGDNLVWDHAKEGAHLLMQWGFPDELVCCVLLHHRGLSTLADPDLRHTSAAAVALSALLPDPLNQVPDGVNQLQQLELQWPEFDLRTIAEYVDEQFQKLMPGSSEHPMVSETLQNEVSSAAG